MAEEASSHRPPGIVAIRVEPRLSQISRSAMRNHTSSAVARAPLEQTSLSHESRTKAPPCATAGAGRPSAGGRLTVGCPRVRNATVLCRNAAANSAMTATAVRVRPGRAPGQVSLASPVRRWAQGAKVRPNPSLEGTRTGMALGPRAAHCHHPSRGPSATPPRAPQLKR